MPAEQSDLFTKAEAAEKLRVSPSTVDRLRARGEIAWVAVGGSVRFRREALDEYIRRAERPARSETERDLPAPRARSYPALAPGPRRRLPEASSDFDTLFPITMPPAVGGEAR
jgi:excisionase family DNA binding protein